MVSERTLYTTSEVSRMLDVPYTSVLRAVFKLGIPRIDIGTARVMDADGIRRLAEYFQVPAPCLSCAS